VAFRRWKVQGSVSATDADRELVELAMQEKSDQRDS
jgi:hypothetical protein